MVIHYLVPPTHRMMRVDADSPCGALIDGGPTKFSDRPEDVTCPECQEALYHDGVRRLEEPPIKWQFSADMASGPDLDALTNNIGISRHPGENDADFRKRAIFAMRHWVKR